MPNWQQNPEVQEQISVDEISNRIEEATNELNQLKNSLNELSLEEKNFLTEQNFKLESQLIVIVSIGLGIINVFKFNGIVILSDNTKLFDIHSQ